MDRCRLIVGLGNPGRAYEKTRHNIGFMVVEALAKKWGLEWKKSLRLQGAVALKKDEDGERTEVVLLMPQTYMNLSGESVRKAVQKHGLNIDELLIVVDDVEIAFGTLRLRSQGSSGGHNGLKSVEGCLLSRDYPRLRMGIGPQIREEREMLEEFVLSPFSAEEQKMLAAFIEKGCLAVEQWVKGSS